jgi:hypothetical protein
MAELDDPEHPLTGVVVELAGDEKSQTEFFVTICRRVAQKQKEAAPAEGEAGAPAEGEEALFVE